MPGSRDGRVVRYCESSLSLLYRSIGLEPSTPIKQSSERTFLPIYASMWFSWFLGSRYDQSLSKYRSTNTSLRGAVFSQLSHVKPRDRDRRRTNDATRRDATFASIGENGYPRRYSTAFENANYFGDCGDRVENVIPILSRRFAPANKMTGASSLNEHNEWEFMLVIYHYRILLKKYRFIIILQKTMLLRIAIISLSLLQINVIKLFQLRTKFTRLVY